jgi:multidrug resistance efflux pump
VGSKASRSGAGRAEESTSEAAGTRQADRLGDTPLATVQLGSVVIASAYVGRCLAALGAVPSLRRGAGICYLLRTKYTPRCSTKMALQYPTTNDDAALSTRAPTPGAAEARSARPPMPAQAAAGHAKSSPVRHGQNLFRRQALEEHMAIAREAEVVRIAPPWSQAVFWLATSLVVAAVAFSCLFQVEQTAFARGILRAPGGVQTLASPIGGIVLEVGARSGDVVGPDNLLARIDSAQTRKEIVDADHRVELAQKQLDAFEERRTKMEAERLELLHERGNLLEKRVAKQYESISHARAKQATYQTLAREGLASKLEKKEVDDGVTTAEREVLRMREEKTSTALEIVSLEAALDEERTKWAGAVAQAKGERDALQVMLTQSEVRAPRAGRLEAMLVKVGDQVNVGTPIGKLVPVDAARQVIVFVLERDRAFLVDGQAARIEVDQLPVGEFGSLLGKITRIASDLASPTEVSEALGDVKLAEPVFRVELELEANDRLARLGQLLRPGSLVTARFALRKQRIITLLFAPLRRFFA